jgi:phosphoserine aminotransferase
MTKQHNFSAGPGILPEEVLQQAAESIVNFKGMRLSLLEISHRDKKYVDVMDEARSLAKKLLQVGDDYEAMYLGGGASLQFCMVPYNLLPEGGKAAYLKTGTWASNAAKEAANFGHVQIVASSEDKNFNYIPKEYQIDDDAAYFHVTSNNTIFGTQMKTFPKTDKLLICDMSSDMYSRKVDGNQFGLIYAGAQKNMGPAGATLVVVRKDILGKAGRKIPTMLNYETHIKGESMYNTPPVFPVYVCLLTLQWLEKNGGVEKMEIINQQKADLLYTEIDRNGMFKGTVVKEDRSTMNVTFVCENPALEDEFLKLAKEADLYGLKGHRSVGGFRASIYNACPISSVQALVDTMQTFEKKFG